MTDIVDVPLQAVSSHDGQAAKALPRDIAPRRLVPTERQLESGDLPSRDDAAAAAAAAQPATGDDGPGWRSRLSAYLSDLNPRSVQGSKLPLAVFCLLGLFAGVDDAVFLVILPELRAEFGGDVGPLLAAATAVTALVLLSAPFFGYLVDRVSRVRLVQVSQIGTNLVGLCAPLFGRSLLGVTLYRGASGFVGGMQSSAPASLLPDYYDTKSFSKVLVVLPAMAALGGIFTPVAAGFAVDGLGGWRPAAISLGLFATAISLSTLLLREPPRGGKQLEALGAVEDAEATPPVRKAPTAAESLRIVRGIATMRRIWIATIFTSAASFGFNVFLALYWAQVFGLTPSQRGLLAALGSAVQFAILIGLAPLLSRVAVQKPSRIMLLFGVVVMVSSLFVLVLAYSNVLVLSVAASIPLTAGTAALAPAIAILLIRLVPADVRGFGLTSIAPFSLVGMILFQIALSSFPSTAGGLKGMALTFMPFYLIGGYLLATAARSVDRDIRAADAATVARLVGGDSEESSTGTLLVVRDVGVEYQGTTVLDGVDLDVSAGEFIALLGTNGAGKSTLLKVICGIVPAANGAIYFDGNNITQEPPHLNARRGIVMVPGGRAVFPTLTVRENLRSATLIDDDGLDGAMSLEDVFALFPVLEERLEQRAGDLSGGEQQMVALGQALLMRPQLMMIDELSLGLAPAIVDQLLDALREINQRGTTIVIVEQSVNVALTVASRAVFMDKGAIRFDGATEDLLARPDLVRSVFMGGAATGVGPASHRAPAQDHGSDAISVESLTVDFGGIRAVDGVTLGARPGEVLGILGPNGAGKTTLFDCISGFVPTGGGKVLLEGVDMSDAPPDARARAGLARSFQDARLFPSMTVRENIAVAFERLAARNAAAAVVWAPSVRRSEDRIRRRVDGLIDLLNLGELADKFVSELSTGSRRAVDVAVVMAADPKVLLLDEPSSGLAQAEVEALGPVISRLARETGAAVLVIEHDLSLLSSVSHRLAAMERGRLLVVGEPATVLRDQRVLSSYLNATEGVLARSGSRLSSIAGALGADMNSPAGPTAHHSREETP